MEYSDGQPEKSECSMGQTEPLFPKNDNPKCTNCQCPTEPGLFISILHRRVCQVCFALWHNSGFDTPFWRGL